MSGYLSGLIGTFSTDARVYVPALVPDLPTRGPHLGTVAVFNPSWVGETENLGLLRRQIVFFDADPTDSSANGSVDPEMAALNIVGLLRGTQALAAELGGLEPLDGEPLNGRGPQNPPPAPLVVLLTGGSFVVTEIEPGYFLVCFAAMAEASTAHREAMVAQVQSAIAAAHAAFTVLHSPLMRLESLLGRAGVSACLERHWRLWRRAYNLSAAYGPEGLTWPNRLNPRGFLGMLPGVPFQRLSVRANEELEEAVAETIGAVGVESTATEPGEPMAGETTETTTLNLPFASTPEAEYSPFGPSAVLVFHTDDTVPKRAGLVHLEVTPGLLLEAVGSVCRLMELFSAHDALDPEVLSRREPLVELYSRLAAGSTSAPDTPSPVSLDEPRDLALTFSSVAQLLNPSNFTETLVVLPLTYSVSGIKSLGVAVNEQISGVTLWWPGSVPAITETSDLEPEDPARSGRFITGLRPLLLYLPLTEDVDGTAHEYLLVLYQEGHALLAFMYDSGLEQLGHADFYSRLHHHTCEPIVDMLLECVNTATGALSSSIGSLPVPLSGGASIAPDIDFFFVVYDSVEKSYQSSLPPLGHELPLRGLRTALFYLHDQLVDHFVVKSAGRVFSPTSEVEEHLHKFSSNRANDWLFYLIHHKHKRIVVIRNYNKNKPKPEPKVADETYLHLLADSVYDYTHLGFLDSLGDDVKLWLEGLRRDEQ